jgi:uncharacterized protein
MDGEVTRDEASATFFNAAAAGRLLIRRCGECGHWIAPYLRMGATIERCPACTSDRVEWTPAEGTATLVTWTVIHERADDSTHTVGVVELAEGPWLTARVDADPTLLAAGAAMVVGFDRPGGGEPVPVLRLVGPRPSD